MQYRMEVQNLLQNPDFNNNDKNEKKKAKKKKSSQVVLGRDSKMSTQRNFDIGNKLDDLVKSIEVHHESEGEDDDSSESSDNEPKITRELISNMINEALGLGFDSANSELASRAELNTQGEIQEAENIASGEVTANDGDRNVD